MKSLRKLSLILALLFFALSTVVVLIDVLGDYHIIAGALNSNQILAILSSIAIVFFLCYLVSASNKGLYIWFCTVFIGLTGLTSLFISFMPQHRYTEIISEDGKHAMIVEEKTTSSSIYIRVYEEIDKPLYNSKYAITLTKKKVGDSYQYGDFDIVFEERLYKIYVPLYSKSPSVVLYRKK